MLTQPNGPLRATRLEWQSRHRRREKPMDEPNQLHETILGQIDNMRPAHLIPGEHVGAKVVDKNTVEILVVPTGRTTRISYVQGADLYAVTIFKHDDTVEEHERVYCDQLGEMVF